MGSTRELTAAELSIVCFTHARVRPYFSGCGIRLEDTLQSLASGAMKVEDLPMITVISNAGPDGTPFLFSMNNRRLWVLKQLLAQGYFSDRTLRVRVKDPLLREVERYTIDRCSLMAKVMRDGPGAGGAPGGDEGSTDEDNETEGCEGGELELELELELEPEPEPEPERQPCWECSGEGVIGSGKRRKACGSCSGSGWEQVSRSAGAPKPSRRKPAKQRPAATEEPASGEPASGEAAALTKMSVRDLRQRGRQLGVPEPELTVAIEGDNPKKALIALIEALGPPSAAAEPEPEPELLDVSVEVGTQSAQPSVEERLGVARAKNAAGEKLSMKEKKLIKQHGKEPSHSDRAGAADEQLKPS